MPQSESFLDFGFEEDHGPGFDIPSAFLVHEFCPLDRYVPAQNGGLGISFVLDCGCSGINLALHRDGYQDSLVGVILSQDMCDRHHSEACRW